MSFSSVLIVLNAISVKAFGHFDDVQPLPRRFAPKSMGALSKSGIPLNALLLSSSGIALATLLNVV